MSRTPQTLLSEQSTPREAGVDTVNPAPADPRLSRQIIARLFWKEFRAQRQIWLAILLCTFVLQLLYFTFDPQTRINNPLFPLAMAIILAICHLAASTGVLFASEREDDSHRLLQALPLRTRDLLIAKLGYAALANSLFVLVVAGWTLLIFPGPFQIPRYDDTATMALHAWQLAATSLGIFTFTLLASLRTSRGIVAIVTGAAALLIVFTLTVEVADWLQMNKMWATVPVLFSTSFAAFALSMMSAPRWLRHRELPLLPLRWRPVASWGPRAWRPLQGLLYRSATLSSPARRAAGVLLWKEVRAAVSRVVIVTVLCGLAILAIHSNSGFPLGRNSPAGFLAVILVLPIAALWLGLAVFSQEQRAGTMGFLYEKAVPPATVWSVKQAVGLTSLVVVSMSLFGLVRFLVWNWHGNVFNVLPQHLRWMPDAGPRLLAIWCMHLCIYAWGQLASLFVRGGVLSFALGAAGTVLLVGFGDTVLPELDLPFPLVMLPLAAAAVLATLALSPDWLKQKKSWALLGKKVGWVVLPLLGTFGLVEWYRVVQIPLIDPGFAWRAHEAKMFNYDPALTQKFADFVDHMPLPSSGNRDSRTPQDLEDQATIAAGLRSLAAEIEHRSTRIDPRLLARMRTPTASMFSRLEAANHLAHRDLNAGRLEACWEQLRANLVVASFLQWHALEANDFEIYEHARPKGLILLWAQHPDQSLELLNQANTFLWSRGTDYRLEEYRQNSYVINLQALQGRELGMQLQQEQWPAFSERWANTFPLIRQVEAWRAERVFNQLYRNPYPWNDPENTWYKQYGTLMYSTPALRNTELLDRSLNFLDRADRTDAGLKVCLEQEAYRKQFGEYPKSLFGGPLARRLQLLPKNTLEGFQYVPEGLPFHIFSGRHDEEHDFTMMVAAGRPVLSTVPLSRSLQIVDSDVAFHQSDVRFHRHEKVDEASIRRAHEMIEEARQSPDPNAGLLFFLQE